MPPIAGRPGSIPAGGAYGAVAKTRLLPPTHRLLPRSPAGRAFVYKGRAYRPFLAPRYAWAYRPIAVGGYLAPAFWSPNYFVVDYGWYGLAPPPPDYGWIRYGPDLLMMQLDSGAVAQEIPGAFVDGGGSPGYGGAPLPPESPPGFPVSQAPPAYPTEPPPEAPPAFRYMDMPVYSGDPDELPGDPPPPGAG